MEDLFKRLYDQYAEIDYKIKETEALLEDLNKKKTDLTEHISSTLLTYGVNSIGVTLEDEKHTLTVETKVFASMNKEKELETEKWLTSIGDSKLFKRTFEFGKNEEKVRAFLKNENLSYEYAGKVNSQSLSALVRERLKSGLEVPEDIIKVSRTTIIKLK